MARNKSEDVLKTFGIGFESNFYYITIYNKSFSDIIKALIKIKINKILEIDIKDDMKKLFSNLVEIPGTRIPESGIPDGIYITEAEEVQPMVTNYEFDEILEEVNQAEKAAEEAAARAEAVATGTGTQRMVDGPGGKRFADDAHTDDADADAILLLHIRNQRNNRDNRVRKN